MTTESRVEGSLHLRSSPCDKYDKDAKPVSQSGLHKDCQERSLQSVSNKVQIGPSIFLPWNRIAAEPWQSGPVVRRFACKLSAVPVGVNLVGKDACCPGKPAKLTLVELKLHYVLHYLHMGAWDDIIPDDGSDKGASHFFCRLCNRQFSNDHVRGNFPARGSILCHLALCHGLLVEAMEAETRVDFSQEIQELKIASNLQTEAKEGGQKAAHTKRSNLVHWVMSPLWKLQEKVRALEEARKKLREAKEAIEQDGSADEHDVKQEVKDGEDVSDLAGHTKQQHEQKDRPRRPKPKFLECPLCDEYKGNSDPSILRMHIFKHYLDRWNAKVDQLKQGDRGYRCDQCQKMFRKTRGAPSEEDRITAACHLAISHQQLRTVLEDQPDVPDTFVQDLYWDLDNTHEQERSLSCFSRLSEYVKTVKPEGDPPVEGPGHRNRARRGPEASNKNKKKLGSRKKRPRSSDEESSSSLENGDDHSCDLEKGEKAEVDRGSKQRRPSVPGRTNKQYIRKRKRVQISLDSDDGTDSGSDREWWLSGSRKRQSKPEASRVGGGDPEPQEAGAEATEASSSDLNAGKKRLLPKRQAAAISFRAAFEDEEDPALLSD